MKFKLSIIFAAILAGNVYAFEAPAASKLVGQTYVGAFGTYLHNDTDRTVRVNDPSPVVDGKGLGANIGYRFSENVEFRAAYTDLTSNIRNNATSEVDGSIVDFDALYFPNAKNGYVILGLNSNEINELEKRRTSFNLGAGYRHYLSEQFAVYAEGQGFYNFADNLTDFTANLGVTYFFGVNDSERYRPTPAPEPKPVKAVKMVEKDTDGDGVLDKHDACPNSDKAYKVDQKGCTVYENKTQSINLLVHFENNKAEVLPGYMGKIKELAEFMQQFPDTTVVIQGHTSQLGSAAYNQQLSEARAQAVAEILVNNFGIAADRVSSVGYGESRLLDPANTKEAHRRNRRIEAKLTSTKQTPVKR